MSVPYESPAAFRRALTDRLRKIARPHGMWALADLQRQFAYDRLLVRLYSYDEGWVVKGATALLARAIAVRHTIDVDLYRATSREEAERDLRRAVALDLGDWFGFEIGRGTPIIDGDAGVRLPVTATIGAVPWARFHVDIVVDGIGATGVPDDVPPLIPDVIPGLHRTGYRVCSIPDHIADKILAIMWRHGKDRKPSTRFKDLVDLVAFVSRVHVVADEQICALRTQAERRDQNLPAWFDVPDPVLWLPGYAAEARRAYNIPALVLDDALDVIRPFVDPLLSGVATGVWDPGTGVWQS